MSSAKQPDQPGHHPSALAGVRRPSARRGHGILFHLARIFLILVVLVAILLPAIWYLAPPFVLEQAQKWYAAQGKDYRLSLGGMNLQFWNGRIEFDRLLLEHPGVNGGKTELQRLVLDIDTGKVRQRVIDVTELELDGLHGSLHQTSAGLQIAGLTLAGGSGTAASADTISADPLDRQLRALPQIRVPRLVLNDIRVKYQTTQGPLQLVNINLDSLILSDFDSHDLKPLTLKAGLRVLALKVREPETVSLEQPLSLKLGLTFEDWLTQPRVRGDLTLGKLKIRAREQLLVSLDQLRLAGINLVPQAGLDADQSLGLLRLEGLTVSEAVPEEPTAAGTAAAPEPEVAATSDQAAAAQSVGQSTLATTNGHADEVSTTAAPDTGLLQTTTLRETPVVVTRALPELAEQPLLTLTSYQVQRLEYHNERISTGAQELDGLTLNSGIQEGYLKGALWLGPILAEPTATPAAEQSAAAADATGDITAEAARASEPEQAAISSDDGAVTNHGGETVGDSGASAASVDDSAVADTTVAGQSADSSSGDHSQTGKQDASRHLEFSMASFNASNIDLVWQQPGLDVAVHIDSSLVGQLDTETVNPLTLEGSLTVARLDVGQPLATPVSFEKPVQVQWQGEIRGWRRSPELAGDLTINNISVLVDRYLPVVVDQIQLQGIKANRQVQGLELLKINGAAVRELPKAGSGAVTGTTLIAVAGYSVPQIYFDGDSLTTGVQEFAGLQLRLERDANGNILMVPQRPDGQVVMAVAEPETKQQQLGLQFRIAGLHQQDGSKSLIFWNDRSVKPDVRTQLTLQSLSIGAVSNASLFAGPEDTAAPVSYSMQMAVDEFNSINLDGQMALIGGEPDGILKARVQQLNLVPFSPYVINAIGYRVKKGMLDLNVDMALERSQMKGMAKIRLQNSKFEPADERIIESVSKQISMPVETALSVLKDDNNNLKLELPLSGSINDPDVGLDDILQQISKTAVKTATVYYLKQLFQPYGTLISLASYAGDKLMAIRLDPVSFTAGSAELSDDHKAYLTRVADILKDKSDLELQACPFVTEEEARPLGDQWPDLASQRAIQIKAWLAGYKDDKGKSLSARVTLCDAQKGKKPEVQLGF